MNNIIFENVKLAFANFSGRETDKNARGKRNFNVVIEDEEFAEQLANDGWNVKFKTDKEGNPYPPMLKVNISYPEDYPHLHPQVMMEQAGNKVYLDEETIGTLDSMEIVNVKALVISPGKEYNLNGMVGVPAYLKQMRVEVAPDIFCD